MTKDEVARLKERLKAEYQEKLRAIDIVEKMLAEQSSNGVPNGAGSDATLRERIEGAISAEPKKRWTLTSIGLKIGTDNRSGLWKEVRKLIDDGKVKQAKKGSGRTPAEYAWVNDFNSEVKS